MGIGLAVDQRVGVNVGAGVAVSIATDVALIIAKTVASMLGLGTGILARVVVGLGVGVAVEIAVGVGSKGKAVGSVDPVHATRDTSTNTANPNKRFLSQVIHPLSSKRSQSLKHLGL